MIITILFVHFVADFIVQTRWQAMNKSKHVGALALHVATYSACFLPLAFVDNFTWYWLTLNAFAHFATDGLTSQLTTKFWNDGKPGKPFWTVIGFDQFIHSATLIGTWMWMCGGGVR